MDNVTTGSSSDVQCELRVRADRAGTLVAPRFPPPRQAIETRGIAEQMLSDKQADIDYARAQAELVESMAQLAAIRKLRDKTKR